MGKSKKGSVADEGKPADAARPMGPTGGIDFSEAGVEAAAAQVQLGHVSKPHARDAWERAKPWMLEQRQKLEGLGWAPVDKARTELYVLKRMAPHGSFTDDGFVYVRVPAKFIDFTRSAKARDASADGEEAELKRRGIRSKKRENAPSHALNDPLVWKIKIDGAESTEADRVPNVALDVVQPMENIMYLVMTLAPGLIRLHASRKDAMLPGSHTQETRDDPVAPSVRHSAIFAASEQLARVLPPAFWFKRNSEHLRKILGDAEFEAAEAAANDEERATSRILGDVAERTWEEMLPPPEQKKKKSKKAAAAAAANNHSATDSSPLAGSPMEAPPTAIAV